MNDYLSTVVKSGQVNTPPGSYVTLKEWAVNSFMDSRSTLLEVGCSTGFIAIEMARYTGAICYRLDLHEGSIATARDNIDKCIADRVSFHQGDAGRLPFPADKFSHLVIGGHLPFVSAGVRHQHINESLRVIRPWGYMLVALYYYHVQPSQNFVDEFNVAIGTKLSPTDNKSYWTSLFDGLSMTLEYESEYGVSAGDEVRVQQYINQMLPETRQNWKQFLRLFNENAKYLRYFVRVYRKIPNETDIMLQIPRGGIYNTELISRRSF